MTGIGGGDERAEIVRMNAPLPFRTAASRPAARSIPNARSQASSTWNWSADICQSQTAACASSRADRNSAGSGSRGWGVGGVGTGVHGRLLSPASGGPHFDPFPALPLPASRKPFKSSCFHHLRRVCGSVGKDSSKGRTAIAGIVRVSNLLHKHFRDGELTVVDGSTTRNPLVADYSEWKARDYFPDLLQRGGAARRAGRARLPDRRAARGTRPLRSRTRIWLRTDACIARSPHRNMLSASTWRTGWLKTWPRRANGCAQMVALPSGSVSRDTFSPAKATLVLTTSASPSAKR